MDTPRGFKDISTTYQAAYITTDGNVQVRRIGVRLWEILVRGGVAATGGSSIYETSKDAALTLARKLASPLKRKTGGRSDTAVRPRRLPRMKQKARR